ncbi:MAG: ATP synthase F0 subunit C [Bdellovibrionales bacterium]|nr:ATP synthase F0 subunit C [Bdellovibrionales bacterium]
MTKRNVLLSAAAVALTPALASASEDMAAGKPMYALGKGFAVGIAALGCALAQGKIVGTAVDGIARNPGASGQIFTPMLLGVAFVETLLIFTLFLSGINA